MSTITFETGQKVNFEGNPTPQDVDYVASQLGIKKSAPQQQPSMFDKASGVASGVTDALGLHSSVDLLGDIGANLANDFNPKTSLSQKVATMRQLQQPTLARSAGAGLQVGATAASFALPNPTSLTRAATQYGLLGATSAGGESASRGNSAGQVVADTATGGAFGAAAGPVFNLLGKGISAATRRVGPSLLQFTTGVPQKAISQASLNPEAAREGLKLPVNVILEKAETAHSSLMQNLGQEFQSGLEQITKTTGQTKTGVTFNQSGFVKSASEMRRLLNNYGRDFAREFRIGTRMTPAGAILDFSKSPIVKAGEVRNVQEAFNTIGTWRDFSPKGLQDLAERMGALRNFESGARTESSAILSKIYNRIAGTGGTKGLIPTYAPKLAELRTNYAKNRTVLDTIGQVLNASKHGVTNEQSAVARLDNIFKENRDVYVNAIDELGKRSGIDILSLLAGGEFQKILPNYIRGIGGAAAVGAGTHFVSPWAILLSPLFSPRFAGLISRNASRFGEKTGQLTRGLTTQAIQRFVPKTD